MQATIQEVDESIDGSKESLKNHGEETMRKLMLGEES